MAVERTFTIDRELLEKELASPNAASVLPELAEQFVVELERAAFSVRIGKMYGSIDGLPMNITVRSDSAPLRRAFEIADSIGFPLYVRGDPDYKEYHRSLPPRRPTTL